MRRALVQSSRFARALKRLLKRNPHVEVSLRSTLARLEQDAFDPLLRTHKLKGERVDVWSCSAGYDLRILFRFVVVDGAEAILLQTLGTHDEVY